MVTPIKQTQIRLESTQQGTMQQSQVEPLEQEIQETQERQAKRVQLVKLVPLSFWDKKSQHQSLHQQ
jgi:hypothetical protein